MMNAKKNHIVKSIDFFVFSLEKKKNHNIKLNLMCCGLFLLVQQRNAHLRHSTLRLASRGNADNAGANYRQVVHFS